MGSIKKETDQWKKEDKKRALTSYFCVSQQQQKQQAHVKQQWQQLRIQLQQQEQEQQKI